MNYLRILDEYGLDVSGATLHINKFSNLLGFNIAKNNPNPVSAQGKLKYSGVMTDGIELRVFQNLDGSFETAFPFIL